MHADDRRSTERQMERSRSDASTPEGRRAIFERLFNDAELVLEVGHALRRDEPEAVNRALARANGGVDPGFNATQIDGLRSIWVADGFALLRPCDERQIAIEALWFWRELIALAPDEVKDFHEAITTWGSSRGSGAEGARAAHGTQEAPGDAAWQRVVQCLHRIGLGQRWTEEHALALVRLNRDDIKFKNLKWFGVPGDAW